MKKFIVFLLFSSMDRKRIYVGLNRLEKEFLSSGQREYTEGEKKEIGAMYTKLRSYFV